MEPTWTAPAELAKAILDQLSLQTARQMEPGQDQTVQPHPVLITNPDL